MMIRACLVAWCALGVACADVLVVSFALRPRNDSALYTTLAQVSDPRGPEYGKYVGRDEAVRLLEPQRGAVGAVKQWLDEMLRPSEAAKGELRQTAKIESNQAAKIKLELEGSILRWTAPSQDAAAQVLATNFSEGVTAIHTVPQQLLGHVVSIWTRASATRRRRNSARAPVSARGDAAEPGCANLTTPVCLRALYRMDKLPAAAHAKSRLGVVGFTEQAAQHDQLDAFLTRFAPYASGASFDTVTVNNGTNSQVDTAHSGEGNLDIQYAVAMAYPVPVTYYAVGGVDRDLIPDLDLPDPRVQGLETWLPLLDYLVTLNDPHLPPVLTISYGENEQLIPAPRAHLMCAMFAQLGARGVSVIVASGDGGPGISCARNTPSRNTPSPNTPRFLPDFPSGCPFVTSVGATQPCNASASVFSSGGFSDYWQRPAWQDAAVAPYLRTYGKRWSGYFDPRGRAFPDVAAQGEAYPIINHGKLEVAGGTSASAPTFAAMIALLNDARFSAGKPALGFLNPWLYSAGYHGFTDITQGRSEGCAGKSRDGFPAPVIAGAGWDAAPGWDAVTGLGTPIFDRLRQLVCV